MSVIENGTLTESKISPAARGKRVATLRRLTGLSRRLFKEKYGIPKTTLQTWEQGTGSGLSDNGARKIIPLLKVDGIICSYEWLMFGVGQGPQLVEGSSLKKLDQLNKTETIQFTNDEQEAFIAQELLLFHQHYSTTAIDYVVADDGMEPRYFQGEYVAGCRRHGEDIEKLVGRDCIVQIAQGDLLLRHIKKREANGLYTLACINPATTVEKPLLYDVDLLIAAPVVWVRRKDY